MLFILVISHSIYKFTFGFYNHPGNFFNRSSGSSSCTTSGVLIFQELCIYRMRLTHEYMFPNSVVWNLKRIILWTFFLKHIDSIISSYHRNTWTVPDIWCIAGPQSMSTLASKRNNWEERSRSIVLNIVGKIHQIVITIFINQNEKQGEPSLSLVLGRWK